MRLGLLQDVGAWALEGAGVLSTALDRAAEAERLGLDSVLFDGGGNEGAQAAIPAVVSAVAARTSSIRIGAVGREPILEHPTHLAEDFASADRIASGRVILGVSPGRSPEAFQAAGISWDERESRFCDAVELIRTMWTQTRFQYVGEHYRFPPEVEGEPGWRRRSDASASALPGRPDFLSVLPRPVQLPHPPIWVGSGQCSTIQWAARRGLTFFGLPLATVGELREQVAWYDEALASAGRDRNEVELVVARDVFLAREGDEARAKALPIVRRRLEAIRSGGHAEYEGLAVSEGLDAEECLRRCVLAGSPQEVAQKINEMESELGVTHLVCRVDLPDRADAEVMQSIRWLASDIHPRVMV